MTASLPLEPAPAGEPAGESTSAQALQAEALFYLRWARGAGGRWLPGETLPGGGRPLGAGPAAGGAQRAGAGDRSGPTRAPALAEVETPQVRPSGPSPDSPRWSALAAEVAACRRCALCATRTQTVFGAGSLKPRLVVVGEAPGQDEDVQGLPFVGPAGQLLTRMLNALGLSRSEDVYILNVLKCRPPANRAPAPNEVAACKPYLREQLELLGPPLLLALGNHATRALLATERGIGSLRGRFTTTPEGWRVMPTFHPAYLLRNPAAKRDVWDDLQRVAADLGLALPRAAARPGAAPPSPRPGGPAE